jgi:phosphatidylglycerol:prolipoprotein diacylglycerol transferase
MYPTLFRLGEFEVTSFGALVALAALTGLWIFHRELARSGLPPSGVDAALVGVLGGLAGAKIVWAIEFRHDAPFLSLLLSRGGLSWFGGFLGGVSAGLWSLRRRRIPLLPALAAAAPALAVGHAVGRIGCFLVGDDYGRPTHLPWGVAFPRGLPPTAVPVHPTQLYETVGLALIAWALVRWRRRSVPDAVVFGRYLVLAGMLRFAIEIVRVNAPILGPLTLAQLFSCGIMVVGAAFIARARRIG